MSRKFEIKHAKIGFFNSNHQLYEMPKLIFLFFLCFYIDIRNMFDQNNELLF